MRSVSTVTMETQGMCLIYDSIFPNICRKKGLVIGNIDVNILLLSVKKQLFCPPNKQWICFLLWDLSNHPNKNEDTHFFQPL